MGWHFLRSLAGVILWVVANAVYMDQRKKGIRGFGRFLSFWAGLPGTFIILIVIREGVERIDPPPDDDERLLREVRIDRELRGLGRPPTSGQKTIEGDALGGEGSPAR